MVKIKTNNQIQTEPVSVVAGSVVLHTTSRSGRAAVVVINPLSSTPSTRTAATAGHRAGQVIETSTVQRSTTHSLLRSMSAPQEPNMEPMPDFSRSVHYGSIRYAAAKSAAQHSAESAENSSSKTTDE